MKIYDYDKLTADDLAILVSRKYLLNDGIMQAVAAIGDDIRDNGDKALLAMAEKFDHVRLESLAVSAAETDAAVLSLPPDLKSAIDIAFDNIVKFHESQRIVPEKIETTRGLTCWREFRAIETVGLYVPGGTAPLFSTALMLGVPAMIADCRNIYLSSPPGRDGHIPPAVLYIARKCGVKGVFKAGGAGAVFAFAHGSQTIPKVDKIFGPGNQYVTGAKMQASKTVAIDMPAGPSEVLVVADHTSDARFAAADLLAQAEHGADSQCVLVSDSIDVINAVLEEVKVQLAVLPRKELAEKALTGSFCVQVKDLKQAIEFSNIYAPEHLILGVDDHADLIPRIENAGSVFLGHYASESFGDYASGTNHTLPTSGFARSLSGVSLLSFGKIVTFQEVLPRGLLGLGPHVSLMAEREDLFAHRNAVDIRMKSCEKELSSAAAEH